MQDDGWEAQTVGMGETAAKVLIVDDTPENLEIAGRILEKDNYDIYIADSGMTAIELLDNVQVDLVLLDIMMPEIDGYETCERIKARSDSHDTPVIFLSAKADVESVNRGFECGAVDYIRKPFNPTELRARVRTHLVLMKVRKELEQASMLDPLTHLLNRREMLHRMDGEFGRYNRNAAVFSLLHGQIDELRALNEQFGHACGDAVLAQTADRMRASLRRQDSLARWSGREFLVLLPDSDAVQAFACAEKLRHLAATVPSLHEGKTVAVTMTFGVATFDREMSIDDILARVEGALLQGRKEGGNMVISS